MNFLKYLMGSMLLMDEAGDKGGGGGKPAPAPAPDNSKDIEALRTQNADLMKRLEALEGKKPEPKPDDQDLKDKADKDKQAKDQKIKESKDLESALRFDMTHKEWLKTNASILPKEIEGIFSAAEKETYDTIVQKASALKAGVVKSFFAVQENLDLLTSAQKSTLDEWLKLTKTSREERAGEVYDSIFEPTFESKKKIKKAIELQKSGGRYEDDNDSAYKEKIMKASRKHYLGEKQNA